MQNKKKCLYINKYLLDFGNKLAINYADCYYALWLPPAELSNATVINMNIGYPYTIYGIWYRTDYDREIHNK